MLEKRTIEMNSLEWAIFLCYTVEDLILLPNTEGILSHGNFSNSDVITKAYGFSYSAYLKGMKRDGYCDYCITEIVLVNAALDALTYVTLSIIAHILNLQVKYQRYIEEGI